VKPNLLKLGRDTIIYGFGLILNRFLTFIFLPVFTRFLSPSDYGIIALISLIIMALSGILNLGTGNSINICYFEEKNDQKRSMVIWTTFVIVSINCIFWFTIISIFANTLLNIITLSSQYGNIFILAFMSLCLQTISEPFLIYLRLEQKSKKYILYTLINSTLYISTALFLIIYAEYGITGLFIANFISQLIVTPIIIGSFNHHFSFQINKELLWPLIRIGFPSIFGMSAFLIVDYADRLILQKFLGLEELGIYSIGYGMGMLILLAVAAFGSAWPPYFSSFMHRQEEAQEVFGKVLKYYIVVSSILSLLFFAFAKPVIFLITAPPFHGAYDIVGIVALSYAIKGSYLILLPGIYFVKKLHFQALIEWIAAIINILLNLLFIPWYGKMGAAFATLLSYLTLPISAFLVGRRYLTINYEWIKISRVILSFLIAVIVLIWSTKLNNIILEIMMILFFFISYIVIIIFGAFDNIERKLVWKTLKSYF